MKQILIVLASLLVLAPTIAYALEGDSASDLPDAYGAVFHEQDRYRYVNHSCNYDRFWCALAMSKDGAFGLSTQRLELVWASNDQGD